MLRYQSKPHTQIQNQSPTVKNKSFGYFYLSKSIINMVGHSLPKKITWKKIFVKLDFVDFHGLDLFLCLFMCIYFHNLVFMGPSCFLFLVTIDCKVSLFELSGPSSLFTFYHELRFCLYQLLWLSIVFVSQKHFLVSSLICNFYFLVYSAGDLCIDNTLLQMYYFFIRFIQNCLP